MAECRCEIPSLFFPKSIPDHPILDPKWFAQCVLQDGSIVTKTLNQSCLLYVFECCFPDLCRDAVPTKKASCNLFCERQSQTMSSRSLSGTAHDILCVPICRC